MDAETEASTATSTRGRLPSPTVFPGFVCPPTLRLPRTRSVLRTHAHRHAQSHTERLHVASGVVSFKLVQENLRYDY